MEWIHSCPTVVWNFLQNFWKKCIRIGLNKTVDLFFVFTPVYTPFITFKANINRNSYTKGLRFLIFCGIINIKKLKGGYLMKKISILFVSILLLNLFSGCQFNKSTEYDAVDLSYEHILELNHFKCYASYLDQETTIEGEEAKELYKIVSESNEGIEHSPSSSQNDYIYLVFYNSTSDYPSTDERTEFYGSYYIYSDGLLQFSGSPYHSAVFSYKLKNNIFDDVLKKTFS